MESVATNKLLSGIGECVTLRRDILVLISDYKAQPSRGGENRVIDLCLDCMNM
jgi:hypothetical protein